MVVRALRDDHDRRRHVQGPQQPRRFRRRCHHRRVGRADRNKAMSLVVVATALPFRAQTVPFAQVGAHWPEIVNLLAGSLLGALFGAGWATRLRSETLYKVIAS